MAVGDDAVAEGYPLVPNSGTEGKVRYGAREINRTRDFIAQLKVLVPVTKAAFQTKSGISFGTGDPTGGDNGDIYFKIVG